MKKIIFLLLVFIYACAGELKIATFNVENLFDDKNNGNEYYDFKIKKTGKSNWNSHKYNKKLKEIASILQSLNADIIALQEIENEEVLKKLASKSGYRYKAFSKGKNSPVGVGFLSKIAIDNTKVYKIENVKTRDILRADFSLDGKKFSLYTTHFLTKNPRDKSKKQSRKQDRIKSAKTLQKAVKDTNLSVVLGDFNTDYSARYDFLLKDIINDGFVNLWDNKFGFNINSKKSSHISGRAIDHILLSSSFFKNGKLFYKNGSFGKFDELRFFNTRKRSVSDHFPIYFTITTDEKQSFKYSKKLKNESINFQEKNVAYKFSSIDEIYGKDIKKPILLKNLVVIYKDKFGISLGDKAGRGVYLFSKDNDIETGTMVDVIVYKTNFYRGNFQIRDFRFNKIYEQKPNLSNYLLPESKLNTARHGDVIESVTGDVKNGKIQTNFGEFLIFSHNKIVKNGKNQTFYNVFFTTYKGKKEFVVK
ncbi:putative endonuclease/exonuclease/phosphatase [Campylobacter blaseri]|uniref:Endonuclease/exonuclease/phosphatase domain-containing protein n=1 Tax=Campylobacter blaseri TaxID=2042961 RepID=A0A2P8R287_9BACT|nr:endonuclease/exonuclease/phosphatase family protein [Campylobacter blaseri]PSM52598.1 hypothetical protein CQ405_02390 [Campylobacter blaseri]PSM54246.1 hypothetical protein CRN67_02390 [Campylobacter blaseri]QKF85896.1 putative endonuclease/exonuclease/phosphatase [Campylobacter blaseri]